MKKRERLEVIRQLIEDYDLSTQQELIDKLAERDIYLTQATISRDMNELGIVKIPVSKGRVVYCLSQPQPIADDAQTKQHRLLVRSVLAVAEANPLWPNSLSIQIVPGSGQALKKHLLDTYAADIFSLLTDDDSMLLLAQSEAATETLRRLLSQHLQA